jgi:hypothetical protein
LIKNSNLYLALALFFIEKSGNKVALDSKTNIKVRNASFEENKASDLKTLKFSM